VQDLLGAYALDAVDDDERQAVERHLEGCQPCRAEVGQHQEVAAFLAAGWSPAPDGVWDRIASSLEETPPAMRPVVDLGAERQRRRPFAGPVRAVAAVGVAASVALVAFLGVRVVDTGRQVEELTQQLSGVDVARAADAAVRRDDARKIQLASTDGRLTADAVLLPDGTGYLVRNNLPGLPGDRTYQLWAVVGQNKISVGVLGPAAGPVAFHADGNVSALAITEEVAGGVVISQQPPTVLGVVA
jgi:anti-sigma factor RsiW